MTGPTTPDRDDATEPPVDPTSIRPPPRHAARHRLEHPGTPVAAPWGDTPALAAPRTVGAPRSAAAADDATAEALHGAGPASADQLEHVPPSAAVTPQLGAVSGEPTTTATAAEVAASAQALGLTVTARPSASMPAVPAPPRPPRPPPVPRSVDSAVVAAPRSRRIRPLPALRIGRHLASAAALEHIRPETSPAGVVLGWTENRQPVSVRMFRGEPTRMTFVGGVWISQLMAFRALALGARIAVFTNRPDVWHGFGAWAAGVDDRVAILPVDRQITVAATALRPVLFLYDGELLAPSERSDLRPWQAQLTVLRQLTSYGVPTLQDANLVAAQRLSSDEALIAASALRLSGKTRSWVQLMRDDMLAILDGSRDAYLWVTPTAIERARFGPMTR